MDNLLFDLVEDIAPKFNPLVMDGLAVEHVKHVDDYVNALWRSAAKGFPEGLKYKDYKAYSVYDEYSKAVRRGTTSSYGMYDIATTYMCMRGYILEFNGVEIEVPLYLPYVEDAGLIQVRGSLFQVSPVLADKALSVGEETIFIPLECAKLTFERLSERHYLADGVRETTDVVFSKVYNNNKSSGRSAGGRQRVTAESTLMHYLLCKYGLETTFVMFGNASVHVGYSTDINEDTYPEQDWVICSSTRIHPDDVKSKYYIASDIRLAIRRHEFTPLTSSLIGGFFYLVDRFPQRIEPEFVNHIRLWRALMGQVLFGGEGSEGRMVSDINLHMESLDEYMDEESRERLAAEGIHCEDLYQLFGVIIRTFTDRVVEAVDGEANMLGKEFMVLRYLLSDINAAIYKFKFALRKLSHKQLTETDVRKCIQTFLKTDVITKINRDHGEVSGVSSPGDNKYFKITCNLVPQTSATGKGRNKNKSALSDPAKLLHTSIAVVGSYLNLPKGSPDGRTRISPGVKTDPDGRQIIEEEEFKPMLARTQDLFKR